MIPEVREIRVNEYRAAIVDNQTAVNILNSFKEMALTKEHGSAIPLFLTDEFQSYTDGKSVHVSIAEFFLDPKYNADFWLMMAKAGVLHECQHINSTNLPASQQASKDYGSWLKKNFDINEQIGENLAFQFFNILEDGRIENIIVTNFPGYTLMFMIKNGEYRANAVIREVAKKPKDEFNDFMAEIFSYAKCGGHAFGVDKYHGLEMEKQFMNIRDDIDRAVAGYSCADMLKYGTKALKKAAPYIAKLLKEDSDLCDFLQNLVIQMSGGDSEIDFNSQGQPGQGALRITVRVVPENSDGEDQDENSESGSDQEGSQGNGSSGDQSSDEAGEDSGSGKKSKDGDQDGDGQNGQSQNGQGQDGKDQNGQGQDGQDQKGQNQSGKGQDGKDQGDQGQESQNQNGDGQNGKGQDGQDQNGQDQDGSDSGSKNNQGHSNKQNGHAQDNLTDPRAMVEESPAGTDMTGDFGDGELQQRGYTEEELKEAMEYTRKEIERSMKSNIDADRKTTRVSRTTSKKLSSIYSNNLLEEEVACGKRILPIDLKTQADRLKRELAAILKLKFHDHYHQRNGQIDNNSLWKIPCNESNLFMLRDKKKKSSVAIYLLIDNSGSMSEGSKSVMARRAAAIIEEAFSDFASCKIVLFASYGTVHHWIIKEFDKKDRYNSSFNSLDAVTPTGGNKDGYSIRVATAEMKKRNEKKKFLIVLSDGMPSDYCGLDSAQDDVRTAVDEARSAGIEVISMPFGSASFVQNSSKEFKYMYRTNIVSANPRNVGEVMGKLFKKILS